MRPTPRWTGSVWQVDLREPWKLGRHVLPGIPKDGIAEAVHAAYAMLGRLEAARPSSPQLALPVEAGPTFVAVVDEYLLRRRYQSQGGKRGVEEYAKACKRDFGHLPVAAFAPPRGTDLLFAAVKRWRAAGLSAGTANNRLCLIRCVLRWASEPERRYVAALPTFPSPKTDPDELLSRALDKWVDEATFRAARDVIYSHQTARNMLAADLRRRGLLGTAAEVHDLVCRRKLFLSFAFYTGMRRFDLWALVDASISPDFACFARQGHKTGIDASAEAVPPPLARDLAAERQRLGRPYRKGEAIAGGPWKNVCRVLASACDLAGVERFNLRDCRRSFVYHKALAGVREDECVRLMGHKDSRMIRTVYLQLLPRLRRDMAGAAWPEPCTALPGTGTARILTFAANTTPKCTTKG
jgi:integrase